MSKKTRYQEKLEALEKLLSQYSDQYQTKGEILAAQRGLLTGWLARIASTDWDVSRELDSRLTKSASLKDTSKPPVRRP